MSLIALAILLFVYRSRSHPTDFQWLLASNRTRHLGNEKKRLIPLLVYEKKYPTFVKILVLVLSKFPLERFLNDSDFSEALALLENSIFSSSTKEESISAMANILETFLSDPDVEYRCRPMLKLLVEQFVQETQD